MSQLPVQTQIDSLNARVSVIDGQGLVAPAVGYTTSNNARVTGLKTDLTQSVLTLEGLLTGLNKTVTSLWTALSTYLGFSPPGSGVGQTVTPPSGDGSGTPATVSIGVVTVLPAGSSPTVVDSGTPSAAILNFGFPAPAPETPGTNGTTTQATSATLGGVLLAVGQAPGRLPVVASTGSFTDLLNQPSTVNGVFTQASAPTENQPSSVLVSMTGPNGGYVQSIGPDPSTFGAFSIILTTSDNSETVQAVVCDPSEGVTVNMNLAVNAPARLNQGFSCAAAAPSGSCAGLEGTWILSQDGHATFADPATHLWVTKI